jgi:hypothetical protein
VTSWTGARCETLGTRSAAYSGLSVWGRLEERLTMPILSKSRELLGALFFPLAIQSAPSRSRRRLTSRLPCRIRRMSIASSSRG